jgi:hypothetical protein
MNVVIAIVSRAVSGSDISDTKSRVDVT